MSKPLNICTLYYTILFFAIPSLSIANDDVTLNSLMSQSGEVKACGEIYLEPGFSFSASEGKTLSLEIDHSLCTPLTDKSSIGRNSAIPNTQSNRLNYIVSITPLDAVSLIEFNNTNGDITVGRDIVKDPRYNVQIQYYDGLGRLTQTVQRGVTHLGADLVNFQEYDPIGRQSNTWLPSPNSGNGAFVADPAQIITDFYGDSRPYSQPEYEDSPLNRVLEQHPPGQNWNGKSVKTSYLTNNSDYPCYLFRLGSSQIIKDKLYSSGELYVLKTEDEDGNTSYEFKDKLGQIVLTRQMNDTVKHDTYYIYDDFGNLRYVLPPMLSDIMIGLNHLSDTDSHMADYAYIYRYDHRNRCISKKLPGCVWKEYIYDKTDQLVAETIQVNNSESNASLEETFKYYIYDNFGRIIHTASIPLWILESIDSSLDDQRNIFKDIVINSLESHPYAEVLEDMQTERKYYDNNYDKLLSGAPQQLQYQEKAEYGTKHTSSQGLEIGGYENTPQEKNFHYALYYDDKARVIQSRQKNHLGGFDIEYFAYDFSGQVTKRLHEHSSSASTQIISEIYEYTYDHVGRLTETKRNNVVLAKNTYDELGRIKSKKQGNSITNTNYNYNIRGWITSIDESTTGMSQKLYYETSANDWVSRMKPVYNGNISGMSLKFDKVKDGYSQFNLETGYYYDNLNRMRRSEGFEVATANNTNEYLDYDKHGNIEELSRMTSHLNPETIKFKHNGNQMLKLESSSTPDYDGNKLYPDTTSNFAYNGNGALTKDLGRGIVTILYNKLSQPTLIQFSNGNQIRYTYSESGERLSVLNIIAKVDPNNAIVVTEGSIYRLISSRIEKETKTDYVGNFIYEDGVLKTVMYEGGYDEYKQAGSSPISHYYVQDHQGNNRAVVNQNKTLVQRTQYHAFGLPYHDYQDPKPENSSNRFKYSGKEFDEMHGLDWYDFHARQYDPLLNRFMSLDPLADKKPWMSPYAYCSNDPISRIDPDGKDDLYYNESGKLLYRVANNDPNTNYVTKTSQSQSDMYPTKNAQTGNVNGISTSDAAETEKLISSGNVKGDHMKNVISLGKDSNMKAAVKSVKDDGTGGTSSANNREYGGKLGGKNGVYDTKQSNAGKPTSGKNLVTQGEVDYHSHPSGQEKFSQNGKSYTASWQQAPSKQDIKVAGSSNKYVLGMGSNTIYVYNKTGVMATIPISVFK